MNASAPFEPKAAAKTLGPEYGVEVEVNIQTPADEDATKQAEAIDNVAWLHGLENGQALIDQLRPCVERAGVIFDSLAPSERRQLSNDPDILLQELTGLGFADPAQAARHVGDWRSGKARSLRSPAAQHAFEAMLPDLLQAIAVGADPDHALNRLSDIVERLSSGVNLFRLLEARPPLAQLLAKVLAHAPALAEQLARRPELFVGLFDDAGYLLHGVAKNFATVHAQKPDALC